MLILELRPLFNVDESVDDWLSWPKPSISSTDEDKTLVDVNHAIFTTKLYIIATSKVASGIYVLRKLLNNFFLHIVATIKTLPAVIGFTPHRSPPNIEDPHKLSPIVILVMLVPNGGRPCDGSRAPGVRKTLVVFLRFFHLARRF